MPILAVKNANNFEGVTTQDDEIVICRAHSKGASFNAVQATHAAKLLRVRVNCRCVCRWSCSCFESGSARDAAAVARFFAPDGDEVFFDGPRIVGANAIRDYQQKAFSTWPASQRFTLGVTNIRMLAPDIAVVETLATFSEGEMRSNRGTAVMVRQGSEWLTAALRVYPAAAAP